MKNALLGGRRDYAELCEQASLQLKQQGWQVDYVEIRRQHALTLPNAQTRDWVILAAARLGKTRLIDNCEVSM
jgi:pantoate--beta-alanine ligase